MVKQPAPQPAPAPKPQPADDIASSVDKKVDPQEVPGSRQAAAPGAAGGTAQKTKKTRKRGRYRQDVKLQKNINRAMRQGKITKAERLKITRLNFKGLHDQAKNLFYNILAPPEKIVKRAKKQNPEMSASDEASLRAGVADGSDFQAKKARELVKKDQESYKQKVARRDAASAARKRKLARTRRRRRAKQTAGSAQ